MWDALQVFRLRSRPSIKPCMHLHLGGRWWPSSGVYGMERMTLPSQHRDGSGQSSGLSARSAARLLSRVQLPYQ